MYQNCHNPEYFFSGLQCVILGTAFTVHLNTNIKPSYLFCDRSLETLEWKFSGRVLWTVFVNSCQNRVKWAIIEINLSVCVWHTQRNKIFLVSHTCLSALTDRCRGNSNSWSTSLDAALWFTCLKLMCSSSMLSPQVCLCQTHSLPFYPLFLHVHKLWVSSHVVFNYPFPRPALSCDSFAKYELLLSWNC